jgi:hypothetical protein
MNGTIEKARTVLAQLEQALDVHAIRPRLPYASSSRSPKVSSKTSTTTTPESLVQRRQSARTAVRLIS